METDNVTLNITSVLPDAKNVVLFHRVELHDDSPLAVVWWKHNSHARHEFAVRIDLQKQVFLDNVGLFDRSRLHADAHNIVKYLYDLARPKARGANADS